ERELGVVQELVRGEPAVLQPRRLGCCDGLAAEVRQRRAAPEAEGGAQVVGGVGRAAGRQGTTTLVEQSLEARDVELAVRDREPVAAAVGLDALAADGLAETVDVHLQGLDGRSGRLGS